MTYYISVVESFRGQVHYPAYKERLYARTINGARKEVLESGIQSNLLGNLYSDSKKVGEFWVNHRVNIDYKKESGILYKVCTGHNNDWYMLNKDGSLGRRV